MRGGQLFQSGKVGDGLRTAPETVFGSEAEAGYGLHDGDGDVVGAVFLLVVGARIGGAVRGPFLLCAEPRTLGQEEAPEVGVAPPSLEGSDYQVHERGLADVPVGVVGVAPFVEQLVRVALELYVVGVERHVDEFPEALARHRVPGVSRVGAQVDVGGGVEGLDDEPEQRLVVRDLRPDSLDLLGVVGGEGAHHLHEPERADELLVGVAHPGVVGEELQHFLDVVAVHAGVIFVVGGLRAKEAVAEGVGLVEAPAQHFAGIAELVGGGLAHLGVQGVRRVLALSGLHVEVDRVAALREVAAAELRLALAQPDQVFVRRALAVVAGESGVEQQRRRVEAGHLVARVQGLDDVVELYLELGHGLAQPVADSPPVEVGYAELLVLHHEPCEFAHVVGDLVLP